MRLIPLPEAVELTLMEFKSQIIIMVRMDLFSDLPVFHFEKLIANPAIQAFAGIAIIFL